MTFDERNAGISAVAAAAEFLAAMPGRIERTTARHHPLPGSGICAGCSAALTPHPCAASRIAELARQRAIGGGMW